MPSYAAGSAPSIQTAPRNEVALPKAETFDKLVALTNKPEMLASAESEPRGISKKEEDKMNARTEKNAATKWIKEKEMNTLVAEKPPAILKLGDMATMMENEE